MNVTLYLFSNSPFFSASLIQSLVAPRLLKHPLRRLNFIPKLTPPNFFSRHLSPISSAASSDISATSSFQSLQLLYSAEKFKELNLNMKTNLMGTVVVRLRFIISARLFSSWSHYDHLIPSSVGKTAVDTSVGERADDLKIQPPTTVGSEENIPNSVTVKEINFVAQKNVPEACQYIVQTKGSYKANMQKHRNRLHLWQNFFTNPFEWWDHSNSKLTPRSPDFKHKDTNEALWIAKNDPSWIKEQLQSYDSRLSQRIDVHPKGSYEEIMQKRRNRLHLWRVFFANPSKWWDHRKSKMTSRSPDFKHKDSDEALWITRNDPPWVNEQLRLYDSRWSKRIDVHH